MSHNDFNEKCEANQCMSYPPTGPCTCPPPVAEEKHGNIEYNARKMHPRMFLDESTLLSEKDISPTAPVEEKQCCIICKGILNDTKVVCGAPSCECHTPSDWEERFDEEFESCNGGDAITVKHDDDGLSTAQYLKAFIRQIEAQAKEEGRREERDKHLKWRKSALLLIDNLFAFAESLNKKV